ncbi:MAG TPA: hypothetical protein VHZ75_08490, partial [Solirubrobacteraceae bacterium]|nr:hypothetical protein [Solirubrobacteraceae bacterium]
MPQRPSARFRMSIEHVGALRRRATSVNDALLSLSVRLTGGETPRACPTILRRPYLAAAALGTVMWLATPNSPPTYDTQWQLLWGEQLARGEIPSYGTGPTVHPLMVAL